MTTVVNQANNIRSNHTFDVYIGRGSPFGNPYAIGPNRTREQAIEQYRELFDARILDPKFRVKIMSLQGKRLVCYCKPAACHGDIIKAWLDEHQGVPIQRLKAKPPRKIRRDRSHRRK